MVPGIQPQNTADQLKPQTVYNLEVQRQHVFRVTSNGLLVHNYYADDIAKIADGFGYFRALKRAHGSAGKGNAWHHIIEQTPNAGKFTAQAMHNPANIIKLPHGKGTIQAKISGYYSSKPRWTGGLTVRQWISQKSFAEQFEFGIKTIKQFGGTKYLPNHMQWEGRTMIEELVSQYQSKAKIAASVDYSDTNSVRQLNASADRMRAIVDEVVSLGTDAVMAFTCLLDKEPAASWAAHHLVEKAELDSATLSRCFSRVEQAMTDAEARGDIANAMGEEMWLNEWKAKKAPPVP